MFSDYHTDFIVPCFYCKEYNRLIPDYPINEADISKGVSDTPRCKLHSQFTCDFCKENRHFNGIAWCDDCNLFTCVKCSKTGVEKLDFLLYDYYYQIHCKKCKKQHPALDAAEYLIVHPFQTGDLRPEFNINLWVPTLDHYPVSERNGLSRFYSYQGYIASKLDSIPDSVQDWNKLSVTWDKGILVDKHHNYVLHPMILDELDNIRGKKLLDFGCGSGGLTRKLKDAKEIIGIDPSNMIDLAMEVEVEERLGIIYRKLKLDQVIEQYLNYFDIIISNMVLIDIENLEETLEQLYSVLKPGGTAFITITHPCFNSPAVSTLRIPWDSERNEDRLKLISNYFDEGGYYLRVNRTDATEMVTHHRKLSTYINAIISQGFEIKKMIEPEVTPEGLQKYPRHFKQVGEYYPVFIGFLLTK